MADDHIVLEVLLGVVPDPVIEVIKSTHGHYKIIYDNMIHLHCKDLCDIHGPNIFVWKCELYKSSEFKCSGRIWIHKIGNLNALKKIVNDQLESKSFLIS